MTGLCCTTTGNEWNRKLRPLIHASNRPESALEVSRATMDSVAHNVRITLCRLVPAETVSVVVVGLVRPATFAADPPHHSRMSIHRRMNVSSVVQFASHSVQLTLNEYFSRAV
ncbi:hypothetical protein ANCCEY_06595 [Ancylostoma ceylanicum]|uniref:Uncharacterized protein n=1 Tax=Ancylostoma ceylanicum TaxID=53326 RepID=A0A0D6M363_9BILA|nr:hypothetical protein ANCCEY_06595 [Ancylostoma ceylanicum]